MRMRHPEEPQKYLGVYDVLFTARTIRHSTSVVTAALQTAALKGAATRYFTEIVDGLKEREFCRIGTFGHFSIKVRKNSSVLAALA